MKKFLKFYLPAFITICALSIFTFYLTKNHENALKCVFNRDCRVVSQAKKAVIKIDSVETTGSEIFEDDEKFYLVFDYYGKNHFAMMQIDKSKKDITFPTDCYEVVFSKYLLLPDCAGGIFYSDKVKAEGFDTQLKITDSGINFVLPDTSKSGLPIHNIEIIFKG